MADSPDIATALKRFDSTRQGYTEAQDFYEGTRPEVFTSIKMRRALWRSGTKFRLNFACTPVDAVLNKMEIKSIQAVDDKTTTEVVEKLWTDNELDLESNDIHKWTLVFGECFVMVWPNEDSTDELPAVDIAYNSPLTMQLFYDPENPRKKLFAAKKWTAGANTRLNLLYPDRIEKYVAVGKKDCNNPHDFKPYYDSDNDDGLGGTTWPLQNPYDMVPVFHYRTDRPHGRPEHANAFGPQDMINKIVANQMATGDFAAFPQRYSLSDAVSNDLTNWADESDDFPFADEELDAAGSREVERSNLTASPGTLWDLKNVKAVGQFAAADPDNFLKPFAAYVRAMASTTTTPIYYFEGLADPPSGAAFRRVELPLNKKVIIRQNSIGKTHSEMLEFGLLLLGVKGVKVVVNWQNPATSDDTDYWAVAIDKVALGVPLDQVLIESGYDPDDAKAWAAAVGDAAAQQARAASAAISKRNAETVATGAVAPKGSDQPPTTGAV